MALLLGQSWNNSCPYLWDHCGHNGLLCDGCEADAEQKAGGKGAPWVHGTTAEYRHQVVRQIAAQPGTAAMSQLMEDGTGWLEQ